MISAALPADHPPIGGGSPAQAARWSLAALLALTVHAGAAWWLTQPAPALPIAEAAPAALEIDVSLLGFAAADQVSAGEEITPVEPVPPTQADTAENVEPVQPTETARLETPVEQTSPTQQTPPPPVEQTQAAEPIAPAETPVLDIPEAVAPSEVQVAAVPPREVQEAEKPTEQAAVQPVEEALVPIPEEAPRPTPRPEVAEAQPEPRRVEPQRTRPARQEAQRPEPRRQPQRQAGNAGRNNSDARQGQADGQTAGRANAAQTRGNARNTRAGNAAVSNYPGQVASKLRRALRFPREARGTRGEVHVAFTVAGGGSVGGVRIARSSGHPALDKAALETVRRAAPFPPIPDGAGRSSWSFTVPLAFTR